MTTLTTLSAADLMQKNVAYLNVDDSIEEAISTFEGNRISGAPVVDRAGRLVGFLSSSDIARIEHVRDGRLDADRDFAMANAESEDESWSENLERDILGKEDYSSEVLGRQSVADWMNPDVISVEPDASLKDVCALMTKESIHRVLVVDDQTVKGIVSTFDVVRVLAREL